MRKFLVFLAFIILHISLFGQKYRTAAGLRIGTELGLTVQQLMFENVTMEGIIQKGLFSDIATVTVLGEVHQRIIFKGFNFYVGAGPHMGFYTKNKGDRHNPFGVTVIGGVEMRFNRLLLSYDLKPAINVYGGDRIFDTQTALSLRYILIKAKKEKFDWKFWEKDMKSSKKKKK